MIQRGALRTVPSFVRLAIPLASLVATTLAYAGPKECIDAADDGQKLRDEGKLTVAREKFIACAAKACPGAVVKQCSQWLVQAEHDLPTVTFRALDEQGKETLDVRVFVDGAMITQSIEARAMPVDPGEHSVRFERADGRSLEDKVVVRAGEKNRIVELSFVAVTAAAARAPAVLPPDPPPQARDSARGFHIPLFAWVGLGVAALGGGTTAVFAVSANDEETRLRTTCAPTCASSEKSSLDTKVLLANVGLSVGIAGIGLAVIATVVANTGSKPPRTAKAAAVALDVAPRAVVLRGSF